MFHKKEKLLAFSLSAVIAGGILISQFTSKAAPNNGLYTTDRNVSYYYRDGEALTGFISISGHKYYFDENNGGKMTTGWKYINGDKYYFDKQGVMAKGWNYIDGNYYYFTAEGKAIRNRWYRVKLKNSDKLIWKYFTVTGKNVTAIFEEYGNKHLSLRGSDSGYAKGFTKFGNYAYLFEGKWGKAAKGLRTIDGNKYFFNQGGYMHRGWKYIDGLSYFFDNTGKMLRGQWKRVKVYMKDQMVWKYFNKNGVNETAFFYENNMKNKHLSLGGASQGYAKGLTTRGDYTYLFEGPWGKAARGWREINGYKYYFTLGYGTMVKGWRKIDNLWYYFRENGTRFVGNLNYNRMTFVLNPSTSEDPFQTPPASEEELMQMSYSELLKELNKQGYSVKNTYNMVATAYTNDPAENGGYSTTALGTPLRKGVIAVDRRLIPLGSKGFIPGVGFVSAEDTGGAIKGNRVDILMSSKYASSRWGIRNIKLIIFR